MLALDLQKELDQEESNLNEDEMMNNDIAVLEQRAILDAIKNKSKSTSVELPDRGVLEGVPVNRVVIANSRGAMNSSTTAVTGATSGAPVERIEEIVFKHPSNRRSLT